MDKKEKYLAPEITFVSFKVEQGFSGSGGPLSSLMLFNIADIGTYNTQGQELWQVDDQNAFGSGW